MSALQDKLKRTPRKPGVYLLKKNDSAILYIGKAKQLKNRLLSHFRSTGSDLRHQRLMSKVTDFEYIVTDTEVEALILESNLIKEHKPRYNVNLKDDKTYPYIRVTHEPFPRVFVTRKIIRDGSLYFGPYTDAGAVRKLMSAVQRIFPLRTCSRTITRETIAGGKHRVCLNYQIGRCRGPCEGRISQEEYAWNVDQVVQFIKGKNRQLINNLKKRMNMLSVQKRYEEAAKVRDEIAAVMQFTNMQKVVDSVYSDRDIITIASESTISCCVVFYVREGRVVNRLHFYMDNREQNNAAYVLGGFLKQFYLHNDFLPKQIDIPFAVEDMDGIEAWLGQKRGGKVRLHIPVRGKKAGLMKMCTRNAELLLTEIMIQRKKLETRISKSVGILQQDLGLDKPPVRIEAFDISNIQGTDSVASLVVFENGRPRKSDYRKYKIKTVQGADDFQSMAEVLERRVERLQSENKPMPDLFMVDGGKGQVSAAFQVLKRHGLADQPLIGLAKRLEEVYLPGHKDPQTIPKSSPGLYLLCAVRDEAHRFAVTFHRQRRKKRTLSSVLDGVEGIGEKRRNKLLAAFGSVEKVAGAEESALARIVGSKQAALIKKALAQYTEADVSGTIQSREHNTKIQKQQILRRAE